MPNAPQKPNEVINQQDSTVKPSFPKKLGTWFKKRPLEMFLNTLGTIKDVQQPIVHALLKFTDVLSHLKVVGNIGAGIAAVSKILEASGKLFSKDATVLERVSAAATIAVVITLVALSVAFATASFAFAFTLAAVSLGVVAAGYDLVTSIYSLVKTSQTLSDVKEMAALESEVKTLKTKSNLSHAELERHDALSKQLNDKYQKLGIPEGTKREEHVKNLQEKLDGLKLARAEKQYKLEELEKANLQKGKEAIANLKKEISELTTQIKDTRPKLQACDTSKENINKLGEKVDKARTSFFANLTITSLAAVGLIAAVILVPLLLPALPVVAIAAAALTVAAGIISLVFNFLKRGADQEDQDIKIKKKEDSKNTQREKYLQKIAQPKPEVAHEVANKAQPNVEPANASNDDNKKLIQLIDELLKLVPHQGHATAEEKADSSGKKLENHLLKVIDEATATQLAETHNKWIATEDKKPLAELLKAQLEKFFKENAEITEKKMDTFNEKIKAAPTNCHQEAASEKGKDEIVIHIPGMVSGS